MTPWKHSLRLLRQLLPVLPLLTLLGDPAHALQLVDAQDGQTALAKLSRKEVTRIAFERGRVRKVTGSAGEFILEKDDEKGRFSSGPRTRKAPNRSTSF